MVSGERHSPARHKTAGFLKWHGRMDNDMYDHMNNSVYYYL